MLKETPGVPGPDADLAGFLRAEAEEHRQAFEALMAGLFGPLADILSIWE